MKKYIIIGFVFLSFPLFSQNWSPTTSSVNFKIKMLGVNVDGTLKGMKTSLKFANNEPVTLSASIDSKSVFTNNSLRDKHLKEKEEFFQPDLFPIINMAATSITKTGDQSYTGIFKLTIKNVSKNIKVPFTFKTDNEKGILKSDFTINRQYWNFGGNTPGMSDNVKVSILLNLEKN